MTTRKPRPRPALELAVPSEPPILRGDILWICCDPSVGAKPRKTRTCIVVSNDIANRFGQAITVIPTQAYSAERAERAYMTDLRRPRSTFPDDRVANTSMVMTYDRTRVAKRAGKVTPQALEDTTARSPCTSPSCSPARRSRPGRVGASRPPRSQGAGRPARRAEVLLLELKADAAMNGYHTRLNQWNYQINVAPGVLSLHREACRSALSYVGAFDELEGFGTRVMLDAIAQDVATFGCVIEDQEIVPTVEVKLTASGKLSTKEVAAGKYWTLDQDHVASCAIRIAREACAVMPMERVIVNVKAARLDPSTGHMVCPTILAVHFTRGTLARLNFATISNLGAFGQRVVKIGLTRRLAPLDRVRELGGASVPFRFDVHAMIFSDDAVGLETALHHEFAAKRVNMVNARREFFYATAQEVKDTLHRLRGSLLQYVDTPEALEWHQSENLRRGLPPAFHASDDDAAASGDDDPASEDDDDASDDDEWVPAAST